MPTYKLLISPAARDDLKNIHHYSRDQWGMAHASVYLDTIKTQLWRLTTHPLSGVSRNELLPGLRSLNVESHMIFYRLNGELIEIIRVLHARQDPLRHVTKR